MLYLKKIHRLYQVRDVLNRCHNLTVSYKNKSHRNRTSNKNNLVQNQKNRITK